jgi:hypothetical protein
MRFINACKHTRVLGRGRESERVRVCVCVCAWWVCTCGLQVAHGTMSASQRETFVHDLSFGAMRDDVAEAALPPDAVGFPQRNPSQTTSALAAQASSQPSSRFLGVGCAAHTLARAHTHAQPPPCPPTPNPVPALRSCFVRCLRSAQTVDLQPLIEPIETYWARPVSSVALALACRWAKVIFQR